jgi:rare lipoprotein A
LKSLQHTNTFISPGYIILIFIYLLSGCTSSPRYTKHSTIPETEKKVPQTQIIYTNPQSTSPVPPPKQVNQPIDSIEEKTSEVTPSEVPSSNESITSEPVFSEDGIATYYSNNLQGHKTSFGERYDKRKYTAAHKTLPFNTMAKVTCIDNEKSVIVRINDRGPHGKNRVIDLSKAAADEIDLTRKGLAKVRVEVFEYPQDSVPNEQSIP